MVPPMEQWMACLNSMGTADDNAGGLLHFDSTEDSVNNGSLGLVGINK
jgi:hypothetical protein